MALLNCQPGGMYVDCTVGGGGHSQAILHASGPDGRVIGFDWDDEGLGQAAVSLAPYGRRVTLVRENFMTAPSRLNALGHREVDGVLFDLGASASQFAHPARGFSFQLEGPLDMRMDRRRRTTAAHLVNRLSQEELARLLQEYGEEPYARRIARAVVNARVRAPFATTSTLASLVARSIPRRLWPRRIHPATRTFLALRIAVNHELTNLQQALDGILPVIRSGGRLCLIAFHSLEDRIVKRTFRAWAAEGLVRLLTKRPITPGPEEVAANPSARSAKLRAVEVLAGGGSG